MVVSAALIDMIGKRAQNSTTLTIKTVMAKIRESVVLGNGSNVEKLVDEQITLNEEPKERSYLAQVRNEPQAQIQRSPGKDENEVRQLRIKNKSLTNH